MAGVAVNDLCISEFQNFKLRNTHGYLIFRISENLKEVVIDQKGDPEATFDQLVQALPPNDCRYAVTHVHYDLGSDGQRSKLVFLLWCPPSSPVKHKLVYAATVGGFKKTLPGVQVQIEGADVADLDRSEVVSKCQRNGTN